MNTIMNVSAPSWGHFNVTLYWIAGDDSAESPSTNSCEL